MTAAPHAGPPCYHCGALATIRWGDVLLCRLCWMRHVVGNAHAALPPAPVPQLPTDHRPLTTADRPTP